MMHRLDKRSLHVPQQYGEACPQQQPAAAARRRLGTVTKQIVTGSSSVAVLAAAGDDQPAPATHDEPRHEPADQHGYVLRGLYGLASAVPRAGSMAGHLGAATVTGALLVTGLEGKNIGGHFPFSLSHFLILS